MIITDDCSELIIALINLIKIKQHLVFTKREKGNRVLKSERRQFCTKRFKRPTEPHLLIDYTESIMLHTHTHTHREGITHTHLF